MIPDKCRLIKFLLQRQNSKSVILDVCRQMLLPGQQARLPVISRVVDMLNQVYKTYLEAEMLALASETASQPDVYRRVIIDQSDMYTCVFSVLEDNVEIPYKFKVAVLIEYIRSLSQREIPVQPLSLWNLTHQHPSTQPCSPTPVHQFLQIMCLVTLQNPLLTYS
ncbi:regulator of MON1-CCZ1 complex-like [Ruditapes philippinarum]|uniref:regulator of MON1-CCZ1 complex-like n=1 Tax=Ruditapes philippinarum TaxID=129788 RepID=UPI00295C15C8|nr:regulator of MON1-CCZ1 complex-like [Ruditapes philippinarum]